MTLTTTHNRLEYVGNGSTTVFPYTFLITAATDLRVYHDGVQQTLGYTISGVGTGSGGNVTYATAPADDVAILFLRTTDQTQQVNLIEGDRLPAEAVEGMFDKAYAAIQDVAERLDRAVRIPPTSEFAEEEMFLPDPADEANQGKALFISEDGTALEARTILSTDIASPVTAQGDLIQGADDGTPEKLAVGATGALLTVVAGKAAWQSRLGGLSAIEIVMKAAGGVINNSTTLEDDAELVFAVAASERVAVEGLFRYSGDASADIKFAFAYPTDGQVTWTPTGGVVVGPADTVIGAANELYSSLASTLVLGTSSTIRQVRVQGIVLGGSTPGTVTLQWAQNAAVVTDTVLYGGSYLVLRRLV